MTRPEGAWARAGLWTLAASGAAWSSAALLDADPREAILCGSVGAGFLLAAVAVGLPSGSGRLAAFVSGLVLASLPAMWWASRSLSGGAWDSPWVVYGLGVTLGAAFAVASAFAPLRATGFRVAMGLVALAGLLLVLRAPLGDLWGLGNALALLGSAALVATPLRADREG